MIWVTRLIWISLPLTLGAVIADATAGWSRASSAMLAVLLYGAWLAATIAVLAPRPASFTVLRVVAPVAPAVALWGVFASDVVLRWPALAHAVVACVLVLGAPIAAACAAAAAYGNEQRYALRVPPALTLLLLPVVAIIGLGAASGPLLLADRHWVAGPIALAVGWSLAAAAVRSVHSLARRGIVLVPNGLVVADPLVVGDPVLLPRERIAAVYPAPANGSTEGTVDTRLGAVIGGIAVQMDERATFGRRGRGREPSAVTADTVLFSPLRSAQVLRALAAHRLPVTAQPSTTPPPTTTSRS